jgi:myo-inositol-1(or 4)-monophosphatase
LPANDLQLLIDAALVAGAIATPFWQNSPKIWEKAGDAGPVTEADLAVNVMLKKKLLDARPDYGWLSEETEDNADRQETDRVFIIDPIDGTRSFIAGEKNWSHSLAVAENGQIIAAAVYLPVLDKLYTAHVGGGAFLNERPIRRSERAMLEGASVLTARPNLDAVHWRDGVPPVERHFRSSLAYRLALVAEGRFDAMLTLRDTWEWDVAAGTLLAFEAGALVTDRHGNLPIFNNKTPLLTGMIAGTSVVQAGLQGRLL